MTATRKEAMFKPKTAIRALNIVRNGFLRFAGAILQVTSVALVIYLSAMVLLPNIGGMLSETVGLTGQTHFYNMPEIRGVPMLCITGVTVFGDIKLCAYMIKKIGEVFQVRIDEGLKPKV